MHICVWLFHFPIPFPSRHHVLALFKIINLIPTESISAACMCMGTVPSSGPRVASGPTSLKNTTSLSQPSAAS